MSGWYFRDNDDDADDNVIKPRHAAPPTLATLQLLLVGVADKCNGPVDWKLAAQLARTAVDVGLEMAAATAVVER